MNDLKSDVAATAPSRAEAIMTAAGWRRETAGGNLECWRLDHERGEYALITADGDCDADPLAGVWTCGRYRNEGAGVACAQDPHHYSLTRALERVATLTVQDEPRAAEMFGSLPRVKPVFGDVTGLDEKGE
jgi:hypothetical protein